VLSANGTSYRTPIKACKLVYAETGVMNVAGYCNVLSSLYDDLSAASNHKASE
jgi:hypothetical protein